MKNILELFSRFPVKLICCIAFGSQLSAYCLVKSIFRDNYSLVNNELCNHLFIEIF